MDASAWIALAGLAVAGFLQAATFAFFLGGLFQKVRGLEARPSGADCKEELAVLNAKFEALEATLREMAHDVKNLLTGKIVPARRRQADNDG